MQKSIHRISYTEMRVSESFVDMTLVLEWMVSHVFAYETRALMPGAVPVWKRPG